MLKRSLGPLQIQFIALGGIIGSAYLLGVGGIIRQNGPLTIPAFLLGGLIVWLVSMAMSELCVGMPREGSFVSQGQELINRPWAAGVGWSYWFNWCAYIPSEMIAGGIILNHFVPQVPVIGWASILAALITAINLLNVKNFGYFESICSSLKIGAMALFSGVALSIFVSSGSSHSEISLTQLISDFSNWKLEGGSFGFLFTMMIVLVNFQGTELIALTAAETKDPKKNIPKASRNVALRIIGLYLIPLSMLFLIFPWQEAGVEKSVFAETFNRFGYRKFATFFEIVIIAAALSCGNSGLYGAVRSLYSLGKEGLAPPWVTHLNSQGVPSYATWLTIGVIWSFLPLYLLFNESSFYIWLISISGFTGAICWISITWCQIRFRHSQKQGKSGLQSASTDSTYTMPGFPYLSYFSLGIQLLCLGLVICHPILRSSLILGVPAFILPALICHWKDLANKKAWEQRHPCTKVVR